MQVVSFFRNVNKLPLTTFMAMEKKPQEFQRHKAVVWDCGSSLYDSFELKSFEQQLDSAICRTQSMPHSSDSSLVSKHPAPSVPKKSNKISRSMHKLFRFVFRPKSQSPVFDQVDKGSKEGVLLVFDRSCRLSTIPEVKEHGADYTTHSAEFDYTGRSYEFDYKGHSAEFINPRINKRTGSERFTTAAIGISCA